MHVKHKKTADILPLNAVYTILHIPTWLVVARTAVFCLQRNHGEEECINLLKCVYKD